MVCCWHAVWSRQSVECPSLQVLQQLCGIKTVSQFLLLLLSVVCNRKQLFIHTFSTPEPVCDRHSSTAWCIWAQRHLSLLLVTVLLSDHQGSVLLGVGGSCVNRQLGGSGGTDRSVCVKHHKAGVTVVHGVKKKRKKKEKHGRGSAWHSRQPMSNNAPVQKCRNEFLPQRTVMMSWHKLTCKLTLWYVVKVSCWCWLYYKVSAQNCWHMLFFFASNQHRLHFSWAEISLKYFCKAPEKVWWWCK